MSQNQNENRMILAIKIDVMKIQKELLFAGKNGAKYLDATVFISNEAGQYGDNGMVTQDVGKDRRLAGEKGAILGNCKIIKGAVAEEVQERGYGNRPAPLAPQMNQQARDSQSRSAPSKPDTMDDDFVPF